MKYLVLIFLFLTSFYGFGSEPIPSKKVIIISDIDDTLKVSHVREPIPKLVRGFMPFHVFPGMNYLLHSLANQYRRFNFYYVSAAFKKLSFYFHSQTLEFAGVPPGELILRESQDKKSFKLSAIRRILAYNTTKRVILFGDNAEYDSEVYKQITQEFPERRFLVFIRKAYPNGSPILEGQIPFLSPLEVVWELQKNGIMSLERALWLNDRILNRIESDIQENRGRYFMPSYSRDEYFDQDVYLEPYRQIQKKTCSFYFAPRSSF